MPLLTSEKQFTVPASASRTPKCTQDVINIPSKTSMSLVASYPRLQDEGEKAYSRLRPSRFLGYVFGACACNRYQALFPPPSGPEYEANSPPTIGFLTICYWNK